MTTWEKLVDLDRSCWGGVKLMSGEDAKWKCMAYYDVSRVPLYGQWHDTPQGAIEDVYTQYERERCSTKSLTQTEQHVTAVAVSGTEMGNGCRK